MGIPRCYLWYNDSGSPARRPNRELSHDRARRSKTRTSPVRDRVWHWYECIGASEWPAWGFLWLGIVACRGPSGLLEWVAATVFAGKESKRQGWLLKWGEVVAGLGRVSPRAGRPGFLLVNGLAMKRENR